MASRKAIAAPFPFLDADARAWPGVPELTEARRRSLSRFRAEALPSTRIEAWKYTNLAALARIPFTAPRPSAGDNEAAQAAARAVPSDRRRLVFVNGRFHAASSITGAAPQGSFIGGLTQALQQAPDLIKPHLAHLTSLDGDALMALNTAFMIDGAALLIGRGQTAEPIELVQVGHAGEAPVAFHPRHLIVVEAGATATLVETRTGEGTYWSNAVTTVVLGEGATLHHHVLQQSSLDAFDLARVKVVADANATYDGSLLGTGAALSRHEVEGLLEGRNVTCRLRGAFLARGTQVADVTTVIDHGERDGHSEQLIRGVLDGKAHGVFQGRIVVRPAAQKTDARQSSNMLMLSDGAEADTKPELEISADDVKCSHGATVGELSDAEVFYLQARGIDPDTARRLLVSGFLATVFETVADDSVRERAAAAVEGWFAS